jgi:hypothetical protein
MKAEQHQRQQQWQAVQAGELRKRLEQHQQQLEQRRQQRAEQGLPSNSTSGGGSTLEQQGSAAGGFAAADGLGSRGVSAGGVDTAAVEEAGRAAAAAAKQQGAPLPSATEVAAYLDKLLTGKVAIKPAEQLGQRAASEVGGVAVGSSSGGGSGPHKGWLRRVAGKLRQRESSMPNAALSTASNGGSTAAAAAAAGVRPGSAAGESAVQRRAGLAGRGEAPLMHIEARHAQAERAAKEMVEAALLQQGIEAYRYVEG